MTKFNYVSLFSGIGGLSDSQRYKQAGNAVTVNVIQAIGERLLTYI